MTLLNKEPVKEFKKTKEFDNSMMVIELNDSARTAKEAAESLNTDVGSIVKKVYFLGRRIIFFYV